MDNWTTIWTNSLWVIGMAGVVTALSHDGWRRGRSRNAPDRAPSTATNSRNNSITWLYASITLIALGLFLNGLVSEPRPPTWMLIVWGALVVLSCSTLILTAQTARQQ